MRYRRNANLADVGRWPRLEIGDEDVIRQAYEETITAAARLQHFATCREMVSQGPIESRQELLATKDIQNFAFHARRLIDNTIGLNRAKDVRIPAIVNASVREWIPITRIINVLIHHQSIAFPALRSRLRFTDGTGALLDEIEIVDAARRPFCVVKSDNGSKEYAFVVEFLVETFQEQLLNRIIDLCSEQNAHLDEL